MSVVLFFLYDTSKEFKRLFERKPAKSIPSRKTLFSVCLKSIDVGPTIATVHPFLYNYQENIILPKDLCCILS